MAREVKPLKPQMSGDWPSRYRREDREDTVPAPWAGVEQALGAKPQGRQRWDKDKLGLTPQRDGPFSESAAALYSQMHYMTPGKASKESSHSVPKRNRNRRRRRY